MFLAFELQTSRVYVSGQGLFFPSKHFDTCTQDCCCTLSMLSASAKAPRRQLGLSHGQRILVLVYGG